eukprot:13944483-Ditylum_brightwellii.AAC.1
MSKFTAARKELCKVQTNVAEIQDEYLEEMVCLQTTNNKSDIATIIENIRHHEEVKSSFQLMCPIAKGEVGGTVSDMRESVPVKIPSVYPKTLSVLGYDHVCRDIYDDDEVMSKSLICNKLHLNQAWDTLCAQGPLWDYIGKYGLGFGVEGILNGNFDPNQSENLPVINHWLKHNIQKVAPEGSIKVNISLDDYKSLMKVQDETTSSSPLGCHYGHYKAILDHDDLCLVQAQMMPLPWLSGFTPSRWKLAINCMLEKDPRNPKFDRLWLIVIVKGDINVSL